MTDDARSSNATPARNVRQVGNHGGAFNATPNRADGLAKGLRKRPPRPDSAPVAPAPEPATQEPDDVAAVDESTESPRGPEKQSGGSSGGRSQRRSRRQKSTRQSEQPESGRTTLSARLPEALKARLDSRSKATEHSHAQILVAAFNHCHRRIATLFEDASNDDLHEGLNKDDLLFAPIPNRVRDTRGTGTTQVTFPLAVEYRTAIDNLVERYEQVPNRNSLIIRVLDAYLPDDQEAGDGEVGSDDGPVSVSS